MWTILKVFIEFGTVLLLCSDFVCETCHISALRSGIEPACPAFEGQVLITRLLGKSPTF